MGPHGDIEVDRVPGLVGVKAPVAVLERGEQAPLGAGVKRLSSHDEPGAARPARRDRRAGSARTPQPRHAARRLGPRAGSQTSSMPFGVEDGRLDLGVRGRHGEKADVASPTSAATKPSVEPAESVRHDDATLARGSLRRPRGGRRARCRAAGRERRRARRRDRRRCWSRRCPDAAVLTAPRRSRRRSRTSGESRNPPCRWELPAACSPSGSRPRRRRCRDRPGRFPWSSTLRSQTFCTHLGDCLGELVPQLRA